jgi:hypothetical protein
MYFFVVPFALLSVAYGSGATASPPRSDDDPEAGPLRGAAKTKLEHAGAEPERDGRHNILARGTGTCPSAYGPGKYTIQLQVTNPGDGSIWSRSFEVYVADEMPLSTPRPAVMMWHGCNSDPEKFESEAGMDRRVGRYQFYSVYARGTSSRFAPGDPAPCVSGGDTECGWSAYPGEFCQTATNPAPDDVHFASIIIEWMATNLCVDTDRIFAAGFSNGVRPHNTA